MKLLLTLALLLVLAAPAMAEDGLDVRILRNTEGEAVAYTAGPDDPLIVEANHYIFKVWNFYQKVKIFLEEGLDPGCGGCGCGDESTGGGGGGAG